MFSLPNVSLVCFLENFLFVTAVKGLFPPFALLASVVFVLNDKSEPPNPEVRPGILSALDINEACDTESRENLLAALCMYG